MNECRTTKISSDLGKITWTDSVIWRKIIFGSVKFFLFTNSSIYYKALVNFLAGNEYIYQITNRSSYELWVKMTTSTDEIAEAKYERFAITDHGSAFKLSLGEYVTGLGKLCCNVYRKLLKRSVIICDVDVAPIFERRN